MRRKHWPVFELHADGVGVEGYGLAVPAYLNARSRGHSKGQSAKAKLPLRHGETSLALALTVSLEKKWPGPAIFWDVDDHALIWSAVKIDGDQICILCGRDLPGLNVQAWKECLLNVIADQCVRQTLIRVIVQSRSRWWEQLDGVLAACQKGTPCEVVARGPNRFQNLTLQPEDTRAACDDLGQQTSEEIEASLAVSEEHGNPEAMFVTTAAARLPGSHARLRHVGDAGPEAVRLSPDAAARARPSSRGAHPRGELPGGIYRETPLRVVAKAKAEVRVAKRRWFQLRG